MPPKAKPKFPFLLLEPSMILARTAVKGWRALWRLQIMGAMLAPHPTRGREFLAAEQDLL
jgi:hypothetical protein